MTIYGWIIDGLWIAIAGYWAVSAMGAKKSRGGPSWLPEIVFRLAVFVVILLALRVPLVRQALSNGRVRGTPGMLLGVSGVGLCAIGTGLAIWARVSLGRNWGIPMSRKDDPELVTTGPYALVRHPIYAGFVIAMGGSALGQSIFWLVPLVLGGIYFLYSAHREERLLLAQFPDRYPQYMNRTKMLIPFLLGLAIP